MLLRIVLLFAENTGIIRQFALMNEIILKDDSLGEIEFNDLGKAREQRVPVAGFEDLDLTFPNLSDRLM